eukprot:1158208-Pelagomonas_calceolata.AAC.1
MEHRMPTPRRIHLDLSSSVRRPNWVMKFLPVRDFTRYTGASYTPDFFLSLACRHSTYGAEFRLERIPCHESRCERRVEAAH